MSAGEPTPQNRPLCVFLDWDCTITRRHMFSVFKPPSKGGRFDTSFLRSIAGQEPSLYKRKEEVFHSFVRSKTSLYEAWGSGKPHHLATLRKAVCDMQLGPGSDNTSGDTKTVGVDISLIAEDIDKFLFGSEERKNSLTQFIISLQNVGCDVSILTKGITSCVARAISLCLPEWLDENTFSTPLRIIDYAGDVFELDHETKTFKVVGTTVRGGTKRNQIDKFMETIICRTAKLGGYSGSRSRDERIGQCKAVLIDDNFQSEIAGLRAEELMDTGEDSSRCPLYNMESIFTLENGDQENITYITGGPSRNGDGLQDTDMARILQAVTNSNH